MFRYATLMFSLFTQIVGLIVEFFFNQLRIRLLSS